MKKIITLILCITMIITTNINVNASATVDLDRFIHSDENGYSMPDPSSMPSGYYYYYKYDEGKAWYTSITHTLPLILNKALGITVSDTLLIGFSAVAITGIEAYSTAADFAGKSMNVSNMGSFCGRALNDITGCKLVNPNTTNTNPAISIPSNEVNVIYEIYQDYLTDNGYDLPDYINVETRNKTFFTSKMQNSNIRYPAWTGFYNNETIELSTFGYNNNSMTYSPGINYYQDSPDNTYLVAQAYYTELCQAHNLSSSRNTLRFTNQMLSNQSLQMKNYKIDNGLQEVQGYGVTYNTDGTYTTTTKSFVFIAFSYNYLPCCNDEYLTVYKDVNVLNQFINETYAPNYFYSEDYYNYSQDNDNTVITNTEEIDNSTETNETIYNSSSESFTEYYTENNYHVDNSVTINNTSEIINNYYGSGDDNGGDDNGGGSGGDSDDDSGILDKLLDALIDLFKMLGKVIAAILTGIVEMITEVLAALSDIMTAINPFTQLLQLLFGFLPDLVVNTISAGLAICVMIAVLKFLRG